MTQIDQLVKHYPDSPSSHSWRSTTSWKVSNLDEGHLPYEALSILERSIRITEQASAPLPIHHLHCRRRLFSDGAYLVDEVLAVIIRKLLSSDNTVAAIKWIQVSVQNLLESRLWNCCQRNPETSVYGTHRSVSINSYSAKEDQYITSDLTFHIVPAVPRNFTANKVH